ncbi:hypothetical protein FSP39_019037 [Pinctada imbricata]|uniref:Low molecular weight phosphotyrosine protein phosphatase n=1 Tax=Pinctada imbricata TaxID=66713 RepID=A0AA88YE11_PINIB|nr:hypothetical protein FSP39_019037 [Pinctada imbricata]
MKTLKKNNLANYRHTVRQVTREDFNDFEYIVGMDHENISDLNDIKPKNSKAKIIMFGDYDTQRSKDIIEDPYYSDDIGAFEEAYIKIKRCCEGFYESLTNTTDQNT